MNPFDLVGLADEKEKLESQMAEEGFWNDVDNANKVNQRIKVIHSKLDKYKKLEGKGEDVEVMFEMAEEEDDEELANEARQ
ncbi:MAG: PCRF domain-containing protein, partial [Eubacteriales bacterium]|nr:PCRF domain-containing protein [Eubacteriales bacterium]